MSTKEFPYVLTPRALEYIAKQSLSMFLIYEKYDEFKKILAGNPPVEHPQPGLNLPAQIVLDERTLIDQRQILRVVLGGKGELELDVLELPKWQNIHESSRYFVLKPH